MLAAALLLSVPSLQAQDTPPISVQGHVVNGTTNKPAAGVQVNYVLMQRGTTPVSTQMTDSEGRFRFENVPSPGNAPALLRAEFQGGLYSAPLLPQQPVSGDIQISVYDATSRPDTVSVKEHAIFLHPSGGTLLVLEQVVLQNNSQPPRTYVNPKGTFPFTLPAKIREGLRVSVQGPAGMPINQAPLPRDSADGFAVDYPIRPGETQVRLEYALDYTAPFAFSKRVDLLPQQMHVVTPGEGVQVTGDSLTPLGSDPSSGFTGYAVVPAGNLLRLEIAGDAPAIPGEGGGAEQISTALVPVPGVVNERRWIILSAAGLILLGGLVYLYRQE